MNPRVHATAETHRPAIRVRPRPAVEHGGWLRLSALVEGLPDGDAELWFDCEPRHAAHLTSRADPWPLALIFAAMQHGAALAVDGPVSRELLANLEAFQETWRLWVPGRYRAVRLAATSEVDEPEERVRKGDAALMVFNGGLDDCFTAVRHARHLAGRQTLSLRAGLLVVGVPSPEAERSGTVEEARALLDDLGLELWTMRTNATSFAPAWEHASGAVLASCLHWFSGDLAVGVMAATGMVAELGARCGSHPLNDHRLGSDRMRIVHDGAEHGFVEKAATVATWPEALRRLGRDVTPRGILTALALSAAGGPPADASSEARAAALASSLAFDEPGLAQNARALLQASEAGGSRQASWREPLRQSLARAPGSGDGAAAPASGSPVAWPPTPRASEIHVLPESPTLADGRAVLRARIEGPGREPATLWFSVEARHAEHLTSLADPFACALQFPAMRSGAALVIHGPVSRVLLRNLEQFQEVWRAWAPRHVSPVPLRADREVAGAPASRDSLMLFSGGLDSSFSVYRHHHRLVGRRTRRIAAGLMVLGFDILHPEIDEFQGALENSRRMLASLDIDLWSMWTNFRDVVLDWEQGHGTGIAACIHAFGGRFGSGLVAATASVGASALRPWGTHVLTDRLLSSDRVQVVTDGEDNLGRMTKPSLIAQWPEGMAGLRVCHESPRRDRNCGVCTKCVMTALLFLANGLPLPSTLRRPDPEEVRALRLRGLWEIRTIGALLELAKDVGAADEPALLALRECIQRNEARWAAETARNGSDQRPLWPRVRARIGRGLRQWGLRAPRIGRG